MNIKSLKVAAFILLLLFAVIYSFSSAKFLDAGTYQKRDSAIIGPFDIAHEISQTFVSNSAYLSKIEFSFLATGYSSSDNYHVFVRLQDQNGSEIAQLSYLIPKSSNESQAEFSFAPQKDSQNKSYRLLLATDAPRDIVFLTGSEYDAYPNGELFLTDQSIGQDLSFFSYDKPPLLTAFRQMVQESGDRFLEISLFSFVLCLLGFMVSIHFLKEREVINFLIYSLLIGVSIPPILLWLLSLAGIRLERGIIIAGLIIIGVISIAIKVIRLRKEKREWAGNIQTQEILAVGLLILLAVVTRVNQVKDLYVPNGLGAETHQMILERIDRRSTIPLDAIYHIGFHSNVYFLNLVTGQGLPETTLLFAQWLSVASGLSFYVLSKRIFTNPFDALLATSLYWFFSPIPAYLINISRFPFMQGMVLLPAAIPLTWDLIRQNKDNKLVAFLILCGLLLSHYGSFIVFVIIIVVMLFYSMRANESEIWHQATLYTGLRISVPLAFIVLTKFYFVARNGPLRSFLDSPNIGSNIEEYKNAFEHSLQHTGSLLWMYAIVGCIFYFSKNKKLGFPVLMGFLAILASNWLQIYLTGHSSTEITNVIFLLSIPVCLFAGYFLGSIVKIEGWIGWLALLTISIAGAYNISGLNNPINVFYSSADAKAMTWISHNTKPDSLFLVNSNVWDGKYEPADGGFWAGVLARRRTIYADSDSEYENIQDFMIQTNPDYLYIGPEYGNISPLTMYGLGLKPIYQADGIYIYAINKKPG